MNEAPKRQRIRVKHPGEDVYVRLKQYLQNNNVPQARGYINIYAGNSLESHLLEYALHWALNEKNHLLAKLIVNQSVCFGLLNVVKLIFNSNCKTYPDVDYLDAMIWAFNYHHDHVVAAFHKDLYINNTTLDINKQYFRNKNILFNELFDLGLELNFSVTEDFVSLSLNQVTASRIERNKAEEKPPMTNQQILFYRNRGPMLMDQNIMNRSEDDSTHSTPERKTRYKK